MAATLMEIYGDALCAAGEINAGWRRNKVSAPSQGNSELRLTAAGHPSVSSMETGLDLAHTQKAALGSQDGCFWEELPGGSRKCITRGRFGLQCPVGAFLVMAFACRVTCSCPHGNLCARSESLMTGPSCWQGAQRNLRQDSGCTEAEGPSTGGTAWEHRKATHRMRYAGASCFWVLFPRLGPSVYPGSGCKTSQKHICTCAHTYVHT